MKAKQYLLILQLLMMVFFVISYNLILSFLFSHNILDVEAGLKIPSERE